MFRSNLKKVKDIHKDIERSSKEHEHRKSLAQKRYERVSKRINDHQPSNLKKRVKEKISNY